MWGPAELDANVTLPGFCFAYCASSRRLVTGMFGPATPRNAISVARATGAKSFSVSKPVSLYMCGLITSAPWCARVMV